MKIFVAAWFFPPATSSEGIVTYKLLRNSKHEYDVCSSRSRLWGYNEKMAIKDCDNITTYSIDTDSIDEWVEWCVEKFDELNETRQYDAIMTRSTPPESILVGERIKEKYPEIKWIASLADPVANNPYEIKAYIDEIKTISKPQKKELKAALKSDNLDYLENWEKRPEEGIRLLCKLKRWESNVVKNADLIISPTNRQLRYILGGTGWNKKFFAVAHSYDEDFYGENIVEKKQGKTILSFLGYSDKLRSLKPVLSAVKKLKEENDPAIDNLEIRIIGNNPRELEDIVLNNYLYDQVKFYPGVDYYKSLELMQESDWLIHVDAFFKSIPKGGSIFFAGKLADYMGAGKPILAITGKNSPSYQIVNQYGGECFFYKDIDGIADCLARIADGMETDINQEVRKEYSAKNVASLFDSRVEQLVDGSKQEKARIWPEAMKSQSEKVLSICVPAYNVEAYLDRCLYTLVNHDMAGYLDIMIVDDGSKDHTAEIGKRYEDQYPGIVRLISKENGGHGSTINKAIELAQGKYFRTVDGDDWVDSGQLSKLLKSIIENHCDADVISSNYHEVNMDTSEMTPITQSIDFVEWKEYHFDELDVENVYLTLASMMIKTEILREMKVKLLEHAFYVDVEFILFPVPYIHTVSFTKHFIYKYMRGNGEQSVAIPNMVKRYDNHNRVMHRVLSYKDAVSMDAGQTRYYNAILMRLLRTHYGLGLIYDKDVKRGCKRARTFDHYLKKQDPVLYKQIEDEMLLVKVARKCSFNPTTYKRITSVINIGFGSDIKGMVAEKGKKAAKGIIYNPVTISIAQARIMNEGPMKKLKDKINVMMGE